jgi:hypothetical protein
MVLLPMRVELESEVEAEARISTLLRHVGGLASSGATRRAAPSPSRFDCQEVRAVLVGMLRQARWRLGQWTPPEPAPHGEPAGDGSNFSAFPTSNSG